MKLKLVIFLLFFCLFFKNVKAEVFYGDYYKVDNLETKEIDQIRIDSYKLYNTFKIEYEDMGYLDYSDEYIKDENDYIYQEKLTNEYRESDEYIKVDVGKINNQKILMKFGYLRNFDIYELEFYNKDKKVNYSINNVSDTKIKNLYDGNLETSYMHEGLSDIIFEFDEIIYIEDIRIVIKSKQGINSKFIIYLDYRPTIELNNNIDRNHIIEFKKTDEDKVEYFYKEKIKLYKYYKENIVKNDIYVSDGDNLILDDYKIVEEYYKRDKLVLSDNLVIDTKDKSLEDFIDYSTGEVSIISDINYDVNGIYKCNFILNDINIIKDILVDIEKENLENNEVNKIIIEDKNESKNIEKTSENITERKKENKKIVKNNKESNIKLINNKKNITTTKKEVKVSYIKEKFKINYYLIYLCLFFLFLIILFI